MSGRTAGGLATAVFYLCVALHAQEQQTIHGAVTDAAGLPVASTNLTIRNTLTGASRHEKSDGAGAWRFADVEPGVYWLVARSPGLSDAGRLVELRRGTPAAPLTIRLSVESLNQQVTVTSGSRVEELRDDAPVKTEVVTAAQMRDAGHERVSDALAEIPGIVTRRGATAAVGGEQVQGIDSRQVLVLMDGLPITGARGVKSGAVNLNRQTTGPLERVEVVKGAASALYGSDAIGGVINLIPREPASTLESNLDVSSGSRSAFDARGDIGTRVGGLTAYLDLERHQQQAYSLLPGAGTTVGPHYERNDLFFRTRYTLSPQAAFTFLANAYHNHETGRATGDSGLSNSIANDSTQNFALTGDVMLAQGTRLQLRAFAGRYDENSWTQALSDPNLTGVANLNERYRRADATLGQAIGSRQFLQVGGEWARDLYRGANRMLGDNLGQHVSTSDVWFQDRIQVSSRATVVLGGRYQDHETFGGYFVPKAGVVVRLARHLTVRASYGHGFRAPDLGQLYYRFANPTSFYQVIGNPNLRPETSRSSSVGGVYSSGPVRFGVNLYRNDVHDLIDTQLIGKPQTSDDLAALERQYGIPSSFAPLLGRSMYIYRNLNRIYTRGFEVEGEGKLGKGFSLRGAYTFLEARDKVSGVELTQRHRHQGFLAGDYVNRKRGLSMNLRGSMFSSYLLSAVSGARAYPYRLWDAHASKRLVRGVSLYAGVDNLFDSTDAKLRLPNPTFDRPDPGRTYRIGLRYSFNREGR